MGFRIWYGNTIFPHSCKGNRRGILIKWGKTGRIRGQEGGKEHDKGRKSGVPEGMPL